MVCEHEHMNTPPPQLSRACYGTDCLLPRAKTIREATAHIPWKTSPQCHYPLFNADVSVNKNYRVILSSTKTVKIATLTAGGRGGRGEFLS
jgi:hypothetical protein